MTTRDESESSGPSTVAVRFNNARYPEERVVIRPQRLGKRHDPELDPVIEFHDGFYVTDDPERIALIRRALHDHAFADDLPDGGRPCPKCKRIWFASGALADCMTSHP